MFIKTFNIDGGFALYLSITSNIDGGFALNISIHLISMLDFLYIYQDLKGL